MAETINLGKFRKKKALEQKEKQAAENRIAYGRKKSEKTIAEKNRLLERKKIDAMKIDKKSDE